MNKHIRLLYLAALLIPLTLAAAPFAFAGPPGATEINGQKVLTLISRDPPGVRCNNNIQAAAELSNRYKIPVQIVPVTFAGPDAKAPAVYYGNDLITADGDPGNGTVDFSSLAEVLEVVGAPRHDNDGLLMAIPDAFEQLKAAIRVQ
ncbi:hypothetical protein TVNIR_1703 [Thioalkalivibrio nitratireducens DSM 14787]|uniref:Uncharacterized protein n=1 Tax=Thioalkalivibrio nitratireducens (strain DSM 14787 / UNIQEM 213 / ALEN2) TaxID=1255043 RepID=L0DWN6_THIND|nr:hypothetical protein [Thioalkalivibrio nitratireducens]AGA33365.1 hypothetical protein TVNIR_1703 [Thioalkalivibrio nitratireducens DSM 14787]